ncbi:MAG: sulfatase [Myxococcota bacterium]
MQITSLSFFLFFCACGSEDTAPTPPLEARPDVLVVVMDTVRADKLSVYGYDKPTSPQLAEVAAAGIIFDDVTAPSSWTWPSHASLFTGLDPWSHGAHCSSTSAGVGAEDGHMGLLPMRSDLPTIAERFSKQGYRTVSLASNRFLDPKLGLTRGFEVAEVIGDNDLSGRMSDILNDDDDRPVFLFVNMLIAHAPWEVSPAPWSDRHRSRLSSPDSAPPWSRDFLMKDSAGIDLYEVPDGSQSNGFRQLQSDKMSIPDADMEMVEDLYTGGIVAADYLLNRLLSHWMKSKPAGVVAITSDHGEYLGEHGLWEHGKTVYPQVLQVPLLIAAPGRLPAKKRVRTPVQMHDLHDTLIDLAGIDGPTDRSLVPIVDGKPRTGPILAKAWASAAWKDEVGGRFALDWSLYREDEYALISASDGTRQLFNVTYDRQMIRDLAQDKPEKVQELAIKADAAFPEPETTSTHMQVSDEVLEDLKALGYIDR